MDYLDLISPAFFDMEENCKYAIIEYLNALPIQEKFEMGIAIIEPTIPQTNEEVQEYVSSYVNLYEARTFKEKEELKSELVEYCTLFGIQIDRSLSLEKFQKEMLLQLNSKTNEQLMSMGVFGRKISQQEVDDSMNMIISGYTISIKRAAIDQACVQLGKQNLITTDFDYTFIADKFPLLVTRLKENILTKHLLN